MKLPLIPILCVGLMLVPQVSFAEASIFSQPSAGGVNYRAPDGSFGVQLPPSWRAKAWSREKAMAFFVIQAQGDAWMQVRRVPLLPGAQARQLAARGHEFVLSKLPHFREVGRRDVIFNGNVGASIFGVYWFQGNAQYPRAVEEVYVVAGQEAYEFHFECFEPMAGAIAEDVNRVYSSFVPHPALSTPKPAEPDEDLAEKFEKVPF